MPKAINWAKQFKEEVLTELVGTEKIAIRLGTLYHDKEYYHLNERVFIRVDSIPVRYATISKNTSVSSIKELDENIFQKYRKSVDTKEKLVKFLSENYGKEVSEDTEVTVIYYVNGNFINKDDGEDPHQL